MPTITETATIGVHPEKLWDEIGAFGSVAEWHPMLKAVEIIGHGTESMRVALGRAGTHQVERLQRLDRRQRLYRYTIEDSSMPVRDYAGEFRIDPAADGGSRVVWSAQFELTPDGDGRTVESVRRFLRCGTESLKRRFG